MTCESPYSTDLTVTSDVTKHQPVDAVGCMTVATDWARESHDQLDDHRYAYGTKSL